MEQFFSDEDLMDLLEQLDEVEWLPADVTLIEKIRRAM